MSPKKRAKRQKEKNAQATPSESSSAAPNKVAVAVALIGAATLAFVLLTTESTDRPATPVPSLTDLERWQAAPLRNVSDTPGTVLALGPEDAPVTIVEFSDFECPYCRDASVVLKRIYERYPDRVRLVFKHYPLDVSCNEYVERQVHMYACRAATMAQCAGEQDRFWEMHDAIFELEALSLDALGALAGAIGLEGDAYATCLTNEETMRALRADVEEGKRLGVQGTPTIFVNGRRAPSFRPASLTPIVEYALSQGS